MEDSRHADRDHVTIDDKRCRMRTGARFQIAVRQERCRVTVFPTSLARGGVQSDHRLMVILAVHGVEPAFDDSDA